MKRLLAAALALGALMTAAPASAKDPLDGLPHKVWCKFFDKLPMDDGMMTDQQMMDEESFYPMMKHNLSRANCQVVVPQLEAALKYARQFPTAAAAKRGGFRMIAPYAEGQGAHYMGPDGYTNTINRRKPNFLLYGGNSDAAPLVGIMWLINSGQQPPKFGFVGDNDHWHRHGVMCMVNGLIVGEIDHDMTYAECVARGGGTIDISNLWMLHAWIVPGYKYEPDIFRPHVPFLGMDPPDARAA